MPQRSPVFFNSRDWNILIISLVLINGTETSSVSLVHSVTYERKSLSESVDDEYSALIVVVIGIFENKLFNTPALQFLNNTHYYMLLSIYELKKICIIIVFK